MIAQLANSKESVQHKINTHVRMYINQENTNYPPHWHTDIEIIYVREGTYKVTCGSQTYNLAEGDILLICPAVIHEISAPATGSRIYIQADFSIPMSIKDIERAFREMAPSLHISKSRCPENLYNDFCKWIDEIREIYFGSAPPVEITEGGSGHSLMSFTEMDPYGEIEIYSILMRFIALAARNINSLKDTPLANQNFNQKNLMSLSSVCTYLSEHFAENITLEDVAAYAGFSKYHFARIFSEYTGTTFYQFLQQKRITFAQALLSNPDLSITDIAYQSGFASSTAFARAFRKSTGYNPSQFRMIMQYLHES